MPFNNFNYMRQPRAVSDHQLKSNTHSQTDNIMGTMFEPALSISTIRPPLSFADAPLMADSLPNIDFGFDELRERMARFTERFDDFIVKGRKRVLEERNQFRINVAEREGKPPAIYHKVWRNRH